MGEGRPTLQHCERPPKRDFAISHRELLGYEHQMQKRKYGASPCHQLLVGSARRQAKHTKLDDLGGGSTSYQAAQVAPLTTAEDDQSAQTLSTQVLHWLDKENWNDDTVWNQTIRPYEASSIDYNRTELNANKAKPEAQVAGYYVAAPASHIQHADAAADNPISSTLHQYGHFNSNGPKAGDHALYLPNSSEQGAQSQQTTLDRHTLATHSATTRLYEALGLHQQPRRFQLEYSGEVAAMEIKKEPLCSSEAYIARQDSHGLGGKNTSHEILPSGREFSNQRNTGECVGIPFHLAAQGRHAAVPPYDTQDVFISMREMVANPDPSLAVVPSMANIIAEEPNETRQQVDGENVLSMPAAPNSFSARGSTWVSRKTAPARLREAEGNSSGHQTAPASLGARPDDEQILAPLGPSESNSNKASPMSRPCTMSRAMTRPDLEANNGDGTTSAQALPPRFRNQDTNCLICLQPVTQAQLAAIDLRCTSCPRIFHGHCMHYVPPKGNQNWRCNLCYRECWLGYGHLPAEREMARPGIVERYRRRLLLAKTYGDSSNPETIRFWLDVEADGSMAADQALLLHMGVVNQYHLKCIAGDEAVAFGGSFNITHNLFDKDHHDHQQQQQQQQHHNINQTAEHHSTTPPSDQPISLEKLERWPIALGIALQQAELSNQSTQSELRSIHQTLAEERDINIRLRQELEHVRGLLIQRDQQQQQQQQQTTRSLA